MRELLDRGFAYGDLEHNHEQTVVMTWVESSLSPAVPVRGGVAREEPVAGWAEITVPSAPRQPKFAVQPAVPDESPDD